MPADIFNAATFCPYPGLRSFNEEESLYFKGRDFHVDRIASLLEENRFLMLTGASGDGKSSLVYAGLIPRAKAGFMKTKFSHWVIADFRPERSPLLNLSISLARQLNIDSVDSVVNTIRPGYSSLIDLYKSSHLYIDKNSNVYQQADELMRKKMLARAANLLIIVDQFEEFFTNPENFYKGAVTEDGKIIVNLINETNRIALQEDIPVYIICTMRSDYIGNCAAFRGLPELIGKSHYFIPRLNRDEIIQAIKEPAELSGNEISERLVERLVNDIREGMDVLPVLQHALKQIWSIATQDKQKVLDLIHYAKAGGLSRSELPSENLSEFDTWLNGLPEFQKKLYQNPCLTNVLNAHANEIYDKILEACGENDKEMPSDPALVERIIRTSFTCLTRMDENKAVRDRMSIKEITNVIGHPEIDFKKTAATLNAFREPGSTLIRPFVPYYKTASSDDFFSRAYDENTVLDITHEALIRNWERLKIWVSTEQDSIQIFNDLCIQLKHWLDNHRSKQYFLSQGQFYYFKSWYDRQNPTTSWLMRYMGDTKKNGTEKTMDATEDEKKFQKYKYENAERLSDNIRDFLSDSKKAIDLKKTITKVSLGLITVLGILSFIGFLVSREQKDNAIQSERRSKSNEIAYMSIMKNQSDPTYAFRLAEEAYKVFPGDIAKEALMSAYVEPPFYQKYNIHQGISNTVDISPDGNYILTSSKEKEAKILDLHGNLIHQLNGHTKEIKYAEYSSNGNNILTWSDDMSAILWDKNGNKIVSLPHDKYLRKALFNPAGDMLLSLTDDGLVYVWDLQGKLVNTLKSHTARINDFSFSKNGKWIITCSDDATAKVWDSSGKLISTLTDKYSVINGEIIGDKDGFLTLSNDSVLTLWNREGNAKDKIIISKSSGKMFLSPDQKNLLITKTDNTIDQYTLLNENINYRLKFLYNLKGHNGKILFIKFNHNSEYFISGGEDLICRYWNTKGNCIYLMKAYDYTYFADFKTDNKLIVTGHNVGTIRLWDIHVAEHTILVKHTDKIWQGIFSPDGNYILTASWDKTAGLWSKEGKLIKILSGHFDKLYYAEFSPDNKYILTSSFDNTAMLWDINGNLITRLGGRHYGPIYHGIFSHDGKYILLPSKDEKASLWKTELNENESDRFLTFLKGHTGRVRSCAFSRDNKYIITGSNDNTAKIWDLKGNQIKTLKFHKGEVYDISISYDNKYIALASSDNTGTIWTINGEKVAILNGHSDMITCVTFSHDSRFVVTGTGDNDNTAKLWDLSGKCLMTFTGHSQFINFVCLSTDDKLLLTSSDDGTARLWDLQGNCINVLKGNSNNSGIQYSTFSPDNKTILTTSQDGTARLWPLTIDDVLHKINVEKTRGNVWNLTDEIKKQIGVH